MVELMVDGMRYGTSIRIDTAKTRHSRSSRHLIRKSSTDEMRVTRYQCTTEQQDRRDAASGTASRAGVGFSGDGEEFSAKSRGRTVWCRPSRIPARFVGDSVYVRDELFGQA
jgi:hypothetical protein